MFECQGYLEPSRAVSPRFKSRSAPSCTNSRPPRDTSHTTCMNPRCNPHPLYPLFWCYSRPRLPPWLCRIFHVHLQMGICSHSIGLSQCARLSGILRCIVFLFLYPSVLLCLLGSELVRGCRCLIIYPRLELVIRYLGWVVYWLTLLNEFKNIICNVIWVWWYIIWI